MQRSRHNYQRKSNGYRRYAPACDRAIGKAGTEIIDNGAPVGYSGFSPFDFSNIEEKVIRSNVKELGRKIEMIVNKSLL